MRSLFLGALGAVLLASAVAGPSPAATRCLPMQAAPGDFLKPKAAAGVAGVFASSFFELHDETGRVLNLSHGVDLSDHNRPDYDKLKACGATFAIIKLYPDNPRFNTAQIKALDRRQIAVIPYYYLEMPGPYKYFPEKFLSDEPLERIIADTTATGQADAQTFLNTYDQLFGADRSSSVAGLSGMVIALDVEEAIQTDTPAAKKARKGYPAPPKDPEAYYRYGQAYTAMVASWVKTILAARPDATILFYTYPDMYMTYLSAARPEDLLVIHGLPVWLAEYTDHGGDLKDTLNTYNLKGAQRLCLSSTAGNKCVVHQYTGRGSFAGSYVDLNRFFPVVKVRDGAGWQFVRKVEYVQPAPAPGH